MKTTQAKQLSRDPEVAPPFLTLAQASRLAWLPRKLAIPTIWRWARRGLWGCRLRTTQVGGAMVTTEAWLREFFAALAALREGR